MFSNFYNYWSIIIQETTTLAAFSMSQVTRKTKYDTPGFQVTNTHIWLQKHADGIPK